MVINVCINLIIKTNCLSDFLERKYSPGAAIDWYYQYQSMYLSRLLAHESQPKETQESPTALEQNVTYQPHDYLAIENNHQGNSLDLTVQSSSNALLHMGITSKETSYPCPKCPNNYSRLHSLNRHLKFECGVEPQFECPLCHKKSKHKHNLMLHMRTHQKP